MHHDDMTAPTRRLPHAGLTLTEAREHAQGRDEEDGS